MHGIRAQRTVRALSKAVAWWQAFGRYDRVLLAMTRMGRASSELAAVLAADARRAQAAGRRLGFLPPLGAADLVGAAPRTGAEG